MYVYEYAFVYSFNSSRYRFKNFAKSKIYDDRFLYSNKKL